MSPSVVDSFSQRIKATALLSCIQHIGSNTWCQSGSHVSILDAAVLDSLHDCWQEGAQLPKHASLVQISSLRHSV